MSSTQGQESAQIADLLLQNLIAQIGEQAIHVLHAQGPEAAQAFFDGAAFVITGLNLYLNAPLSRREQGTQAQHTASPFQPGDGKY